MTDTPSQDNLPERPARTRTRPTLGSRPGFWPTAGLAAASFLLVFELLAYQLGHANEQAVSGSPKATAAAQRPVLLRRIVKTRVVADAGSGATVASAPASGSTSSSTTASTAAAPAPAPAPAPAAPVVSSSS
jgi:PPE-repeat protein